MSAPLTAHEPHIYVIAGEHSGDQLGGALLAALRQRMPFRLSGLGGEHMKAQGLHSLFPIEDIAVIGIAEIIPHIFRLKRRIREVADDIIRQKPDIVISIDSPGFSFRVIDRLQERGYKDSLLIHYVAQTVWAYRPGRAEKAARKLDALMTLFSFEAPYFTKYGLKTEWVGHEAAWHAMPKDNHAIIRDRIVAFPGSRKGELKRHLPLFRNVAGKLKETHPDLTMVIPLPEDLKVFAERYLQDWPCPLTITDASARRQAMATAHVALCKSGTISLECALSHTPMVITYKANPISAWVVRRTLQTKFVGLANILLGYEAVPERIQEKATPDSITQAIASLLDDPAAYDTQQKALGELRNMLLPSKTRSPSECAADFIVSCIR